ncbi:hypothetical protein GCM10017781_32230 [Deinococcus metalli]|uniref:Uncharacterized protein n=1 Tax=Deinococcus metalli TaxID=1141878 RepID=A0ABQ3JTA2_9DEIO|nr:hypothetical protein GCM10017781_32230 [Deinococcus metalli]
MTTPDAAHLAPTRAALRARPMQTVLDLRHGGQMVSGCGTGSRSETVADGRVVTHHVLCGRGRADADAGAAP